MSTDQTAEKELQLFNEVFVPEFVKSANASLKAAGMQELQTTEDVQAALDIANFCEQQQQANTGSVATKVAAAIQNLK